MPYILIKIFERARPERGTAGSRPGECSNVFGMFVFVQVGVRRAIYSLKCVQQDEADDVIVSNEMCYESATWNGRRRVLIGRPSGSLC